MKSNSIIIDFIGDDYIEYSDFWENTYQNLSIDSQILYDSLHSNVIYNIFDEIKLYIRENIDNLDLSIYDYYLLHYLIPDKESLKKYVLNKMVRLWPTTYMNGGKTGLNLNLFFRYNTFSQEKLDFANYLLDKYNISRNE